MGAEQAKKDLFISKGGNINFVNAWGQSCILLATNCYKHLGAQTPVSSTSGPELSVRLREMRSAFQKLRKKVFCSDLYQLVYRAILMQMLLLAKGLYNCSAWRKLKAGEAKKVHAAVMSMYRTTVGASNPKARHWTDDDAIRELQVLSPLSFVVLQRIFLFLRILRKKHLQLLLVLAHASSIEDSWVNTVRDDLQRIAAHSNIFENLRSASFCRWVEVLSRNPSRFKKYFQKAVMSETINAASFWLPTGRSALGRLTVGEARLCFHTCPVCQHS